MPPVAHMHEELFVHSLSPLGSVTTQEYSLVLQNLRSFPFVVDQIGTLANAHQE